VVYFHLAQDETGAALMPTKATFAAGRNIAIKVPPLVCKDPE
jgi:hypothetical protein